MDEKPRMDPRYVKIEFTTFENNVEEGIGTNIYTTKEKPKPLSYHQCT